MKKSGLFAASAAAASATTAISASTATATFKFSHQEDVLNRDKGESSDSVSSNKFAPRFDGLRFIETLVTGHR